MADGHADRMNTLAELLCKAAHSEINNVYVQTGPHTYSLLGLLMHTLYLSFEVDIQTIMQMIEQSLSMGADPNVFMHAEEDGHTFYTVYEFALMLSQLQLYPVDIMDSLLQQFKAAGGHAEALAHTAVAKIEWETYRTPLLI